MTYGIFYNNRHSFRDLDLVVLDSRVIQSPTKQKIKQTVPFMNGDYDFSNLYGSTTFGNRLLEYKFKIMADNRQVLEMRRSVVENWLLGTNGKSNMYDDNLKGYYYLAECIETDFEDKGKFGILKATFEAYPFKISTYSEDNVAWDSFCFETDVLQDTSFKVNGSLDITIINRGSTSCIPTITVPNDFEIVKNNLTYKFNAGIYKDYRFMLEPGPNKLTLKGNGNIDFKFKVEVI